MRRAKRLWDRVREPRVERAFMCAIYLITAGMGLSALLDPPQSIKGTVGDSMTLVWGGLLLIAGCFGAYGVLPGLWWAERVAVQAGFTGAAIYGVIVGYLHFTGGGNRVPQLGAVTIVALVYVMRGYEIRGLNYEPRG